MIPGEYLLAADPVVANAGRRTTELEVANVGDRPIQVGSHFHFFEVNRSLRFDRARAFGMRLNIPAGTAVRFEPGDDKKVTLVALGGEAKVYGLNGLTNGPAASRANKAREGRRRAKLPGRKDLRGANQHESGDSAPAIRRAFTVPPRAIAFGWRIPNSSSKSNAISPLPAKKLNSAAAKCFATAWANRHRRPRTMAPSIW